MPPVLIEPLDLDADAAVRHAAEMEEIVVAAGIGLEQVHHGYEMACWAVNRRALEQGHGIRTGMEDITRLPDGTEAADNADLVAAAVRLIRAGEAQRQPSAAGRSRPSAGGPAESPMAPAPGRPD